MNDQQRAAMQMALEALQVLLTCKHGEFCDHYRDAENQSKKAITALREALAQPQGEHKTDGTPCWCNPEVTYENPETGAKVIVHKEPQGEWVDLTDDEIHAAINEPTEDLEVMMWRANYCRAVIAAFKEKNT